MKPGENLETSVVGPMAFLFALVKIQICQGSSKSGIFVGRTSTSTFIEIFFSLVIETPQNYDE